jgi:hypothetical protein
MILGRPLPKREEPLWLPEDLEWAIAYESYLNGLCDGCRTPRAVWDNAKDGQLPFVGKVVSCRGCEEVADTENEIPEDERTAYRRVVMVPGPVYDRQEEIDEADDMLRDRRAELVAAAERLGLPRPAAIARQMAG